MVWIYHEKQDGLLCGQHCLNNLVQSCVFSAVDLAEIAQEFDRKERDLMLSQGLTSDAARFLLESSGNVDESGNFSLQVLSKALTEAFGLKLLSISSEEASEGTRSNSFDEEEGFVCNRKSHWFSIRRINGKYWNLNSTLENPECISSFAMDASLEQFRLEGYAVFVIRGGSLPPAPIDGPLSGGNASDWYDESELLRENAYSRSKKVPAGSSEDVWSRAGKGRRLGGNEAAGVGSDYDAEENQIAAAIALSLEASDHCSGGCLEEDFGELQDEPPAGASDVVKIQVKFPTKRLVRRFREGCPAIQLWAFVSDELRRDSVPYQSFELLGVQGAALSAADVRRRGGTVGSERLGGLSVAVRLK